MKLGKTLVELNKVLAQAKIDFVLTRFNFFKDDPGDIDILVRPGSFNQAVSALEKSGYTSSPHDQALGGRIGGAQINLVKQNRIKIDLHKDFTWRKNYYFDLDLIWQNLETKTVAGVKVKAPRSDVDALVVAINIMFEKTYITQADWEYLQKFFSGTNFLAQIKRYGWGGTYARFSKWWENRKKRRQSFPVFLPLTLILYSYFEKFEPVSLAYYFFFRTRYLINKSLPYE